jgi:hypothetical protein
MLVPLEQNPELIQARVASLDELDQGLSPFADLIVRLPSESLKLLEQTW